MKSLTDYIQDEQTKLFGECGAFFAFNQKQFNEQKQEGVAYSAPGAGIICPKNMVMTLVEGLEAIHIGGIKQDIAENGIDAIIHRELGNHECWYTGSISACVDALEGYGITVEQVREVYRAEFRKAEKGEGEL